VQFVNLTLFNLILSIRSWVRSERGQDLLEYALLGGLISAAIIAVGAAGVMTGAISGMVDSIGKCIDFKKSTPCTPF
jgi:Flp pilus assembly pilin Flp